MIVTQQKLRTTDGGVAMATMVGQYNVVRTFGKLRGVGAPKDGWLRPTNRTYLRKEGTAAYITPGFFTSKDFLESQ